MLTDADTTTINVHVPNEGRLAGTELMIPFDRIDARRGASATLTARRALLADGRMSVAAANTPGRLG